MYSVYDEVEGTLDSMMAYKACYLCHNRNDKCERPSVGGKCKRCANTYISRPWNLDEDPPTFADNKVLGHLLGLLSLSIAPSPFMSPGGYHTLKISLVDSHGTEICGPSKVDFMGPLAHDNSHMADDFDQIVYRYLLTPKVAVSQDPSGLVAQACLAGGYLSLFFSVGEIIDESENPLNARALNFGLAYFVLGRFSTIVNQVMSLASVRPMSRNARLSLAAFHVVVNRIKIFTSRLNYLRPFYDDPQLSSLLKERINSLEGELREIFQDDCGLIKDWGAPLDSNRKEFKNTTRSLDPLTLTISVITWEELSMDDTYPTALYTPSDSTQSPLPVVLTSDIDLLSLPFAGLHAIRTKDYGSCNRTSVSPSSLSTCSSVRCYSAAMDDISVDSKDTASLPNPLVNNEIDMTIAVPHDASRYDQFDTVNCALNEWDEFYNSNQDNSAEYQQQDPGSPIQWDSDPGTLDVALS